MMFIWVHFFSSNGCLVSPPFIFKKMSFSTEKFSLNFLHWIAFALLSKISYPHLHGSDSGLDSVHPSICSSSEDPWHSMCFQVLPLTCAQSRITYSPQDPLVVVPNAPSVTWCELPGWPVWEGIIPSPASAPGTVFKSFQVVSLPTPHSFCIFWLVIWKLQEIPWWPQQLFVKSFPPQWLPPAMPNSESAGLPSGMGQGCMAK